MPQLGLIPPICKLKSAFAVLFGISIGFAAGLGDKFAQADDSLFFAPIITVEEKASSEVDAKKAALYTAKQKAFRHIVKLMVPVRQQSKLPVLDRKSLENLVYTTDIPNEQMSQGAGLYVADVQIRFRPDLMRSYFKNNNIAFAETKSKRLLILPVLYQAGSIALWEDNNEWRTSWASREFEQGLVPVTQPLGDITDMGVISGKQAVEADPNRLLAIAKKYNADGVLVTIANTAMLSGTQIPTLSVSSTVVAAGWDNDVVTYDFEGIADEGYKPLYNKAITTIYSGLQEKWKESNLIDPTSRGNKLVLNAPLKKLKDWISIRDMFDKLAMVQSYELKNISVENANVSVTFSGRSDALQSAIAQSDYDLKYSPVDQAWTLLRN